MGTKEIVTEAVGELFGDKDPGAVDRWVSQSYIQHSTLAGDGPEALREMVAGLGADFRYAGARVLADGDLVALHGTYYGFGADPMVSFDVFRVENGKLAEHWDNLQKLAGPNPSGHSMTDGADAVTHPERTGQSRALVEDFVDTVLIGGDGDQIQRFYASGLIQHNPRVPDGADGLIAAVKALAEKGQTMGYQRRHFTVAEGEFALVASEALRDGTNHVMYDLFRVDDGKLAEHWDVVSEPPATLPHGNGLF